MHASALSVRLLLATAGLAVAAGCSRRRGADHPTDRGAEPQAALDAASPEPADTAEAPTVPLEGLDLHYVAQGGRPPVSMSLHVAPDGAAALSLTSSWSRPGTPADTLGSFAVALEPSRREALARLVEEGRLLEHEPGQPPSSPDSTTRTLIVARDGVRNTITMAEALEQGPAELAAVERLLIEIIGEASSHPVRAVRASWELVPDGEAVRPTITIAHVGSEPVPVLFLDPGQAGFWLRAEAWFELEVVFPGGSSAWNPVGDRVGSRAVTERLVAEGTLPSGELELGPGASYRFALPALAPPAVEGRLQAHGVLSFHLLGPGLARGLLTFDLPPRPVPPSVLVPAP